MLPYGFTCTSFSSKRMTGPETITPGVRVKAVPPKFLWRRIFEAHLLEVEKKGAPYLHRGCDVVDRGSNSNGFRFVVIGRG